MIVKVNVIINHSLSFLECRYLHPVNALCFEIEKKFSAKALSYGLPRLDIDGVMLYDLVRLSGIRTMLRKNARLFALLMSENGQANGIPLKRAGVK